VSSDQRRLKRQGSLYCNIMTLYEFVTLFMLEVLMMIIHVIVNNTLLRLYSFNLVRTCFKPTAVKLHKKTNDEIKTVTKTFLAVSTWKCQMLLFYGHSCAHNRQTPKEMRENDLRNALQTWDRSRTPVLAVKPPSYRSAVNSNMTVSVTCCT
jgi:hypothetical protein